MEIYVNLDLMLIKRRLTLSELADRVGITLANLSILKTNKARAIRLVMSSYISHHEKLYYKSMHLKYFALPQSATD